MQVVNAYIAGSGGEPGGDLPYFVGSPVVTRQLSGSITAALPAHEINDILLIICETDASAPAWTAPAGWAFAVQVSGGLSGFTSKHVVAWKRAASSSEAAPTLGTVSNHSVAFAGAIRGCVTTGSPFEDVQTTGVSDGNSDTITFASATTTSATQLIVLAGTSGADIASGSGPAAGGDPTGGSGLSSLTKVGSESTGSNNGGYVYFGSAQKASPGATGNPTVSVGTADKVCGTTLVLKPA